uniref:Uncharacterized protein n=1 Tax=Steinernema glaseri TaxID=37863 RepID=A0A1I7Y7H5_9BILA
MRRKVKRVFGEADVSGEVMTARTARCHQEVTLERCEKQLKPLCGSSESSETPLGRHKQVPGGGGLADYLKYESGGLSTHGAKDPLKRLCAFEEDDTSSALLEHDFFVWPDHVYANSNL